MSKGRGDSAAKRCLKVLGEGGAFESRWWERISAVTVEIISSEEACCATGTDWSLRVVLCTGEGIVESAVPLEAQD